MLKLTAALLALACLCSPASAGVVYNWVEETPDAAGEAVDAGLEFTDEAWLAGSASGTYGWNGSTCIAPGLVFLNSAVSGTDACFDLGLVEYELTVIDGGLSGFIAYDDEAADYMFAMDGGPVWTVTTLLWGGLGTGCGDSGELPVEDCEGATGRWVLDRSTVPQVPAPPTLLLILFGFAGLGRLRR